MEVWGPRGPVGSVYGGAVLPPDLVPEDAVATARTYLEGIGAAPLLARLARTDAPASAER